MKQSLSAALYRPAGPGGVSLFVSSYRTGDNGKGKAEQEPNRGKVN